MILIYKVLIVDDDEIERQGLKSLSIFTRFAMTVVADAWNGSQALELAQSVLPDIVISDIRMPVMDGLTFTSKLKEMYPAVHIVLMSGFEDFAAAKQALSIGADAYLTKLLRIDELEHTLMRIVNSLDSDSNAAYEAEQLRQRLNEMRPLIRERLLRDLLLGVRKMDDSKTRIEVGDIGLFSNHDKLAVILLMAEENVPNPSESSIELFMLNIQDILVGMSMALTLSEPVAIHSSLFAVIAFLPRRMDDEMAFDHIQQCATYMLEKIRSQSGCNVTAAISSIRDDESRLDLMYMQAYDTMRLYSAHGLNRVYWYEAVDIEYPVPDVHIIAENIISRLTYEPYDVREQVASFFDDMLLANLSIFDMQALCCELLTYLRVASAKMGYDLFNMEKPEYVIYARMLGTRFANELREHMNGLLFSADGFAPSQPKSHNEALVETAAAYIKSNFVRDISTDMIAQQVFITSAHLRRVFKNITGQTIQDYILATRMDKARELLSTTDLKIFEVAQAVGYEAPPYFNIVFKKYYGKTPGEYRSDGEVNND